MHYGLSFGWKVREAWNDVAVAADELGFESLWMPDHLVLPDEIRGELIPGEEHPPLEPSSPMFDSPAYLCWLAGRTERVRLGTLVYLLALRHPFAAARTFATLDHVSGGRAVCGVGAGWLTTEWEAAQLDPTSRGERLDEAIAVCRRLWTEPVVEHRGTHFSFPAVHMQPKPLQARLPIHVGGESPPALRRAAAVGDGWLGMFHTLDSAVDRVATLHKLLARHGRDPDAFEITVAKGPVADGEDMSVWEDRGITRLIVHPWTDARDPVPALERFARRYIG